MSTNDNGKARAGAMSDQAGAFINETMGKLIAADGDTDQVKAALSGMIALDRPALECVISQSFGQMVQLASALDDAKAAVDDAKVHVLAITAAIKLVYPDDLTPAGLRVLNLALQTAKAHPEKEHG